ncbi:MAG: amidase domain-containing protein, partial [Oscillospiraceae bacterium]
GWYYHDLNNRAPAWTGVDYLYNFLVNNKGSGPFGVECAIDEVEAGDIIQLQTIGEGFHHTPIIVYTGLKPSISTILVAAHSIDCDYRLLTSYPIRKIRFIHILGVRA